MTAPRRHLRPVPEPADRADQAGADGLPVRAIKSHSLEKSYYHGRYCSIFNQGMKAMWKHNRGYLELFAGPGRVRDLATGEEHDGCSLTAARCEPGFNRLAFVEHDEDLAAALKQRLRAHGLGSDRALVVAGDANDELAIATALDFLVKPGLAFVFIDPEDINFSWRALEYIAMQQNPRVDLLINLPIGPMIRNTDKAPEKITQVLGTDRWQSVVDGGERSRPVLRKLFEEQLRTLNFEFVDTREIRALDKQNVLYDLVFASRNRRGIDFWEKAGEIDPYGQRELTLW